MPVGGFGFGSATSTPVSGGGGTILLSEGFEDTSIASRGWYDDTNIAVDTQARPGSSGTKSLLWHWSIGDVAPQGISTTRYDFTPSNAVYTSYWVLCSSTVVQVGHQFYLITTTDNHFIGPSVTHLTTYDQYLYTAPNFQGSIELADVLMIDTNNIGVDLRGVTENRAVDGANGRHEFTDGTSTVTWDQYLNGSQWMNAKYLQPTTPIFTDTTKTSWHRIETFQQLNSVSGGIGQQDGIFQYWADGVLLMNRSNVYFRTGVNPTMQFRTFLLGPYIGAGVNQDQSMWIDDLVLATGVMH